MVVSEGPYTAWMGPWAQSGTEARMYGPQGNLDAVSIKGNEQAAEGSVIAGSYPDLSTEPWADFRAAIETYDAPTTSTTTASRAWARGPATPRSRRSVEASVDGDITGKAFMDAAAQTRTST